MPPAGVWFIGRYDISRVRDTTSLVVSMILAQGLRGICRQLTSRWYLCCISSCQLLTLVVAEMHHNATIARGLSLSDMEGWVLEENIRYGVRPESSTSQGDRDLSGRTIPALGLSHRHSEFQVKSFGEDSDNFLAVNLSTPNSNTMKTSYFPNFFIITAAILLLCMWSVFPAIVIWIVAYRAW